VALPLMRRRHSGGASPPGTPEAVPLPPVQRLNAGVPPSRVPVTVGAALPPLRRRRSSGVSPPVTLDAMKRCGALPPMRWRRAVK
jgi:hypothetical protein